SLPIEVRSPVPSSPCCPLPWAPSAACSCARWWKTSFHHRGHRGTQRKNTTTNHKAHEESQKKFTRSFLFPLCSSLSSVAEEYFAYRIRLFNPARACSTCGSVLREFSKCDRNCWYSSMAWSRFPWTAKICPSP